jgi:hypothetical protein
MVTEFITYYVSLACAWLGNHLASIVSTTLVMVYPIMATGLAVDSKTEKEQDKWLSYWTVFTFIHIFESLAGWATVVVPMYVTSTVSLVGGVALKPEQRLN